MLTQIPRRTFSTHRTQTFLLERTQILNLREIVEEKKTPFNHITFMVQNAWGLVFWLSFNSLIYCSKIELIWIWQNWKREEIFLLMIRNETVLMCGAFIFYHKPIPNSISLSLSFPLMVSSSPFPIIFTRYEWYNSYWIASFSYFVL